MKLYQLLLVATVAVSCVSSQVATVSPEIIKEANKTCENVTETDLEKDKAIENIFVDLVAGELNAVGVAKSLEEKNYKLTVYRLLSVRSWKGIKFRVRLPYLKEYVADKITSFHELDLDVTFKLLGKIGHVLRVAYAGCDKFQCQNGVMKLMEKYQNLLTSTKRLSKTLVNRCLRALNYHKYAYKLRNKKPELSLKIFTKTIPMATSIKDNSSFVVKETELMRVASSKVSLEARNELAGSRQKDEDFKKEMEKLEEEQIQYKEEVNALKTQVHDMKELIKKVEIEEGKVETKQEFVKKMSAIGPKCRNINSTTFKDICSSSKNWWRGSSKICKVHKGIKTERQCTDEISKDLIEDRKQQREALAKLKATLFDKRISIEEQKLEVQKMVRKQFKNLQVTGKRLENLQGKKLERKQFLERATVSLQLASNSMSIVQTQLQKMVDFWDNIVEHTKSLVTEATENTSEYGKDAYTEKILGSGFSWIALAEVLRVAALEMRKTAYAMDSSFMNIARENEIERLIKNEGQEIINETIKLSNKYGERMSSQQNKINELLCKKQMQATKDVKDIKDDEDEVIDETDFGDEDFEIDEGD